MRGVLAAAVAVASSVVCHGGSVAVKLRPAFDGEFRPGSPVWLWVTIANEGRGFDGVLDVGVEGVTYRRPLRVGERTTGQSDALVVARSDAARARVVVRAKDGEVLHDAEVGLGLRRRGEPKPLVVSVGVGREAGQSLFGDSQVAAGAGELPTLAAGYAPIAALGVDGDGGEVPAPARAALAEWVRGGGVVGFLLEAKAPVRSDSPLAELGGCAGRATAGEWLAALRARQGTRGDDARTTWQVGLGSAGVTLREKQARGALAGLLPAEAAGDEWADKGLYAAFGGARWRVGLRWRLVGGAVALLAAGVLAAQVGLRTRRRAVGALLVVCVAALLALVAWGVMLPEGRGWRESVCVVERTAGQSGERRTEVVCLEALGRTRVRLDFGSAEAVVPFYYSADDAGGGGVVVERDWTERWAVECDLTRRTRRCFGAWWPWRETGEQAPAVVPGDVLVRGARFAVAADQGKVPSGEWPPLDDLREWEGAQRALAMWMCRRAGGNRLFRVQREPPQPSAIAGQGVLSRLSLATQAWTQLGE